MRFPTRNRRVVRLYALGVVFGLFCLVYIIRLAALELNGNNIRGHRQDGTTTRTELVQAVRGEIYDRNGKALVTNRYRLDLTFDYSVLPSAQPARSQAILRALEILDACGERNRLCDTQYPLEGAYPNLVYSAAAETAGTSLNKTLLEVLETIGLRALAIQRIRTDRGVTRTRAGELFDEEPLRYVTADDLTARLVKSFKLNATDENGAQIFTDAEIDRLLRILYGMEAAGFSRANDYVLASDVSMDTVTAEREAGVPGIGYTQTATRVYAYPGYASHILGQTGPIYAEDWEKYKELGYSMNATVGISGCEAAFESYLHGQDGVRVVVEDRDGNIVSEHMKKEAVAGQDIYLTIDIDLQIAAEDGLAENVAYIRNTYGRENCRSGAAIAMDPDTGEILALASYPTYDLSTFNRDYGQLSNDEALPLYNRALYGLYAPGSTFKPGVAAAALSEGIIDGTTLLQCAGKYTYFKSYQPTCWVYNSTVSPIHEHGYLNVREAICVSCNCFFYETGRLLGIEQMNRYGTLFGLGEATGIELGEATGILAGPDYRTETHGVTWQATDTIAAAIGQSDNAFTPLQLGVYLSTLINGGNRYAAHLLLRVRDFTTRTDTYTAEPKLLSSFPLDASVRDEVMAGMPVFADQLKISRFRLFSSMRTTDDLTHGISYFNAELIRLEELLKFCKESAEGMFCKESIAGNKESLRTLIILDEILKGTNSLDKLNGSRKFLEAISKQPVSGIIATHDLELSKMENDASGKFHNYCFEIDLGTDVTYTYKIQKGVARNQNATFLLNKILEKY